MDAWSTTGLWLAVIGSGLVHGVSPGMGWPLALSAGLMGDGRRDLLKTLGPLAAGHLLAMAAILMPFAMLAALVTWQRDLRLAAALLVIGAGVWLLARRRHPRFLRRIGPAHLVFWSFAMATAHGAGLMLVPIYLGLCRAGDTDAGHRGAAALMEGNLLAALAVSAVHTACMIAAGGAIAFAAFEWFGPQLVSRSWFNLDAVWAFTLVLIGGTSLAGAMAIG